MAAELEKSDAKIFSTVFLSFFIALTVRYFKNSSFSFAWLSCGRIRYKLTINFLNFIQVRLQLKFAFEIIIF